MTLTVPALPRNIIRLRSPPVSEMGNDGSSIAGPRVYPDSEPADVILQFSDATTVLPQINLPSPEHTDDTANEDKIRTPPVRLTTHNLEKQQEEIESAVIEGSEPTIPAPATAQVQRISPPTPTWTEVFDNHQRHIREWRQYPESVDKPTPLPELAKPLYKGAGLPNIPEASKLIWEQMELEEAEAIAAHHVPRRPKEIRYVDLNRPPAEPSPAAEEPEMIMTKTGMQPLRKRPWMTEAGPSQEFPPRKTPSDIMSHHTRTELPRIHTPRIRDGLRTPAEIDNFIPNSIELVSNDASASGDDSDREVQQLILGETPLLQALISDQIKSDLAFSRKGDDGEEVTWKRTIPATIKFALPKAPMEEVRKAEALFREISYRDVDQMFAPRSVASRKRKDEAEWRLEKEGRKSRRRGTIEDGSRVKGGGIARGGEDADLDWLFGEPEMSGALQGVDDEGDCVGQ
ncbi:hypothetical protein N7G274_008900 [Stereocaulon virgatum]|uniref:Uncharacterized protein n=1 Tax=Stereocaulon virgatum TaxID=373712 RepID=A0ABR3ZZS9_9LECA